MTASTLPPIATEPAPAYAPVSQPRVVWPHWQRVLFRFFAIYLTLQVSPWEWLGRIPFVAIVFRPYDRFIDWLVRESNARLFHVRETLVLPNGSGDTSWAWTQMWLFLTIAVIGTVVWSVLDRKRPNYSRAAYWLRTITRFYVAFAALSYGLIKVFSLQMSFPTLSNLSTPLGDLLPMRLSWLFIGYSTKYQMFSGLAETVAGLLLLPRRTVTLGLFVAFGAFLNVFLINIAYDVPVKLYAGHLLLACTFLLVLDAPRLCRLFVFNKPVTGTALYDPPYSGKKFRYAGYVAKAYIVWFFFLMPGYGAYGRWKTPVRPAVPLTAGIYDVRLFVRNGDTIPNIPSDSIRWRDVVIDNPGGGSVGSTDTLFWQRYRRGYFRYRADTAKHTLAMWRTSFRQDSAGILTARYEIPDTNSARLWGKMGRDSVYMELARSPRHFQLAERQFHWVSEYNR